MSAKLGKMKFIDFHVSGRNTSCLEFFPKLGAPNQMTIWKDSQQDLRVLSFPLLNILFTSFSFFSNLDINSVFRPTDWMLSTKSLSWFSSMGGFVFKFVVNQRKTERLKGRNRRLFLACQNITCIGMYLELKVSRMNINHIEIRLFSLYR